MAKTSTQASPNNSSNHHSESRSARLFLCCRCETQLKICSCCDRGHIYCIDCVAPAREEARQEASKRYQLSLKGRMNHAARQRRYRERQRVKNEIVTHQGSHNSTPMLDQKTRPLPANERPVLAGSINKIAIICNYCTQVCSEFLRAGHRVVGKSGFNLHHRFVPDTG